VPAGSGVLESADPAGSTRGEDPRDGDGPRLLLKRFADAGKIGLVVGVAQMTSGPEMALGCVAPRGKGARDEFLARVWATRIVCVSRAPAASRILRSFINIV
jgi:hypothetical protein